MQIAVIYHPENADTFKRIRAAANARSWAVTSELLPETRGVVVVLSPAAKLDKTIEAAIEQAMKVTKKENNKEISLPMVGLLDHPVIQGCIPYELAELEFEGRLFRLNDLEAMLSKLESLSKIGITPTFSYEVLAEDKVILPLPRAREGSIVLLVGTAKITNFIHKTLSRELLRVVRPDLSKPLQGTLNTAGCMVVVLNAATTNDPLITNAIADAQRAELAIFPVWEKSTVDERESLPNSLAGIQFEPLNPGDGVNRGMLRVTAAIYKYYADRNDNFGRTPRVLANPFHQYALLWHQLIRPQRLIEDYLGRPEDVIKLEMAFWWLACTFAIALYLLSAPEFQSVIAEGGLDAIAALVGSAFILIVWWLAGTLGSWHAPIPPLESSTAVGLRKIYEARVLGLANSYAARVKNTQQKPEDAVKWQLTRITSFVSQMVNIVGALLVGLLIGGSCGRVALALAKEVYGIVFSTRSVGYVVAATRMSWQALLLITLLFTTMAFACMIRSKARFMTRFAALIMAGVVTISGGLGSVSLTPWLLSALLPPVGLALSYPIGTVSFKIGRPTLSGILLFAAVMTALVWIFWGYYILPNFSGLTP